LSVNRCALAHQLGELDVVEHAIELQLDALMKQALFQHSVAEAGFDQQIAYPLLDQAGPHTRFAVGAAAIFDDDTVDAGPAQQMRQHQSGRPSPDNSNLRAHDVPPFYSV